MDPPGEDARDGGSVMYCTKENLIDMFGERNIVKWADLDNLQEYEESGSVIDDRIASAIEAATDEIDSYFRGRRYELPLLNSQSETPKDIVDICTTLAGVRLYENRGIEEFNPETGRAVHRFAYAKERAFKKIKAILAGVLTLDAVRKTTNVPQ